MNTIEFISPATAANLIPAGLALFLVTMGAVSWWIAAHPAEVQGLLYSLRDHPRVMRAEQRYYTQIEFLVKRFRPGGAFGVSFTIGLAALAVSIWILSGVLRDGLGHEETVLFDAPIITYIAAHRLSWVIEGMEDITYFGNRLSLVVVTGTTGLVLRCLTGTWRPLLLLATAVLGAMVLDSVMKLVVARPRPSAVWMAVPTTGYAFPSGHSTETTAAFGAVAYLIAQTRKDWRAKVSSLTIGAVIAFLVGISRVYLGMHWPTDVMAGWLLGSAWLAIIFTISSTIEKAVATLPG